ncbi:MAG: hypothetical protein N3B13_12600, partial [Deltaproteobacteria bacterium]|nr:hypothetical protein [Deltaproteobacteria bacterium]
NGQYCGEDKVCHKGTKPIKDAGPDGGTDAGRDAGKDAGKDAETDTASDISEDILTDAGEDTISEDTGIDTGEDAVTDISEDTGKDTSVNTYIPSVYDMSAGIIKTDKYQIRTVTGTSARPVIETKEIKVYNTKKQRSKK